MENFLKSIFSSQCIWYSDMLQNFVNSFQKCDFVRHGFSCVVLVTETNNLRGMRRFDAVAPSFWIFQAPQDHIQDRWLTSYHLYVIRGSNGPPSVSYRANLSLVTENFKLQSALTSQVDGGWKIFWCQFSHLNAFEKMTCFKILTTHFKSAILYDMGSAV